MAELGEQDEANFEFRMQVHARLLEGSPIGKLLHLYSERGRNSKGLTEKILLSTFGDYFVPVNPNIFQSDKRNENEHNSAQGFRKGAKICFFNEVSARPWCNAIFKTRNSTDPVTIRGCGSAHIEKHVPTYTFMMASNDDPKWEVPPKHSEFDRWLVLYQPNKFVHQDEAQTGPRTFPKDSRLESLVATNDLHLGTCSTSCRSESVLRKPVKTCRLWWKLERRRRVSG